MLKTLAASAFGPAKRHVESDSRYRFYPVYSCAFVLIALAVKRWPIDHVVLQTWLTHRWIPVITQWGIMSALALAAGFGLVGFLRIGLFSKGLSLVGLWSSIRLLVPAQWHPIDAVFSFVLRFAVDWPMQLIDRVAGEGTSAWTMLVAIYLALIWVVVRPLLIRAFRYVQTLERRLVTRWPVMARFERPLI